MPRALFEGVRFWVHDNVPMRERWLENVTDHGGIVTRDINTADVRIADDIKRAGKSAPENAVSWKFIEQSVKNGVLEDVETHRITGLVRNPAAASRPLKGKRVPFTSADDQILANWLAKKELEGHYLSGNKIFQELAEIYPNHTYQSWRTRALNYKGILPKPNMSAADPIHRHASREELAPMSQREKKPPPRPSPSKPAAGPTSGRVKFTEEDDELLLKYVEEAGRNTSGNKIYMALAEEYPHHSWHSWRDRYVRHLEPRLQAEAANNDTTPPAPDPRHTTTRKPVPRESLTKSAEHGPAPTSVSESAHPVASGNGANVASNHHASPTSTAEIRAGKVSHAAQAERRTPSQISAIQDPGIPAVLSSGAKSSGRLSVEDIDLRLAKIKTARLIQTYGRGYVVRSALRKLQHYLPRLQAHSRGVLLRSKLRDFFEDDLVRLQAGASGALVRMSLRLDEENDAEDDSDAGVEEQIAQEMTPRQPRNPKTPKEEFYVLLNEYLSATGAEIIPWPEVQGRTLDLWDLWHTVRSLDQGRSPSVRNWEYIAETLGFDWVETPEVTLQVKKCYEANLGDFEELQEAFEAEDPGSQADPETQESVAQSDAVTEAAEPDLPSEFLPFHSSPPHIQGQKRSFVPDPVSSSVDLGFRSVKRMRYSKDTEIPSTPQGKKAALAVARSSWKDGLSSGRSRAAVVAVTTSLTPHLSSPDRLPQLQQPRPTNTRQEPETQDFGFEDDGFRSQPDLNSMPDTTPSQQLHLENEQLTPIPFSGFKAPKGPYKSPLGSNLYTTSSRRKVIPDSAAARPMNGSIISSIEDPDENNITPKPQLRQAPQPQPRSESPVEAKAKRRSLPASFRRAVSPPKAGSKVQPTALPRASLPTSMHDNKKTFLPLSRPSNKRSSFGASTAKTKSAPEAASVPGRTRSPRSTTTASPAAPPKILPSGPTPPQGLSIFETMDYYISLGYKRQHVIDAFKATLTWGLAAVVMQELKAGRGIPDNWEGVWTAKDDMDLKFVLEVEGEVEARRRERGGQGPDREARVRVRRAERLRRRLEVKHGVQRMVDREMSFRT
ncbi:hypothetical protein CONLIGDRAFT_86917 [Coniochaeta ligniaria NRRL 30616]|uniref:Telomeric repeat-binding factor 2-interacting protein 1 n=1 Tax=Coniochaeta ligniaria NRRL 30616 TaxID=1408157 RepID=A0A1J7IC44_9PEZI|nr:hypothetical protein CONLIGDRAFT_86917 [Coniochaeta ligniaria NRRL 30616]